MKLRASFKDIFRSHNIWVGALVVFYVILGAVLVTHYGESWDEKLRYVYGQNSISAYLGKVDVDLADEKGAFFSMLGFMGAKVFNRVFPDWITMDGWHYMSYLSFVMGVYFFYRLCRRLVQPVPAFAATLLFSTQPLIWGHSFINPKDTPFMAFFLASVSLGLDMVDNYRAGVLQSDPALAKQSWKDRLRAFPRDLAASWKSAPVWMRWGLAVCLAGLACLALAYPSLHQIVSRGLGNASTTILGKVLSRLVSTGGVGYSLQLGISWIYLGAVFFLLTLALLFSRKILPSVVDPAVIAGIFLGLCSDIRTLGPAAGLLVLVYFLVKGGIKAVPTLLKYLTTAAVTIYAFWPYLWGAPIKNYLASIQLAKNFPWDGFILFNGVEYTKETLPLSYLPTVMAIQFTEPALIFCGAGFVLACLYLLRRADLRLDVMLLGAWFAAPIAAALYGHSTIYNNFRQFLFVIPPLFVLAALSFQALWSWIKGKMLVFVPIVLLSLLPGLYWDAVLHPYEYIYYNSLVGGVQGAFRNYEMDYWCTAYKEAMEYVDKIAKPNTYVAVSGPHGIVSTYSRIDLKILLLQPGLDTTPDYVIISSKRNGDLTYYADLPALYQITRDGAVLAVVKEIPDDD